MQVLNNNSSAGSKIGQSLPKPVPPKSVTAQTNTPVKKTIPVIENKKTISPKNSTVDQVISPATTQQVNNSVNKNSTTANVNSAPTGQVLATANPPAAIKTTTTNPPISVAPTPSKTKTSDDKLVPTEQIGAKDTKKEARKNKKLNKKADKRPGKKGIPTILGLLFLIVSLVAGVILFGNGTGLFNPRATPQTTPKNIVTSNLTDKSFTVSFYTDEESIGFIKYGTSASDIKQQASDDRDQLSGVIKPYRLHHITVRGLESNTNYYYLLGTGSSETFDNAGSPYQIKTASNPGNVSPNNQTIYGVVSRANGQVAEGAIVFVTLEGAGALSTLVKSSGSWAVSLANAFNLSLNDYPEVRTNSVVSIKVQDTEIDSITNRVVDVASAQPVPEIIIGQETSESIDDLSVAREELLAENNEEPEELSESIQELELNDNLVTKSEATEEAIESTEYSADQQAVLSDEDRTLDLNMIDESANDNDIIINSTQPIIKANLPPNIIVKVEVHSDVAIETVVETDANGDLVLDIASLEQNLGPGEHTVIYTYIDPNTGEELSRSYDFTVAESAVSSRGVDTETRAIASAETTSLPYGTGDPYVPPTTPPTLSITPTISPTNTPSVTPFVTNNLEEEASSSVRETVVSTESGTYNAGSVFNTLSLLALGLFFSITGVWSFLLAKQFDKE